MYPTLRYSFAIVFLLSGLFYSHGMNMSSTVIGETREISFTNLNYAACAYYPADTDEDVPDDPQQPSSLEESVHALAEFVKEQGRYIDRIDSTSIIDLPVGIISKGGSLDYTLLIKSLTITPDSGAFLEAYMSFEIPQNGRKIAFAAKRIPFSFKGGFVGEAKLELVGDQKIPLSNNIQLILKGDGSTYVSCDCDGFKSMSLTAEIEFSANIIVPEKPDGTPDNNGTLKCSFNTTLYDWNDLVVDVTLAPFQVRGLTGVGFNVKHAVFDFSDVNNAPGMVFPDTYQSSYFSGDMNINLWRGFYLQEASISLPKEFKSKGSKDRINFGARNLIIDERGVSAVFGIGKLLTLETGDMDGWSFSIDSISIALVANQLTGAGFSGLISVPLFDEKSTLKYSAMIQTGGNYNFTVSADKPINMSMWAAKLTLLPTSTITIAVTDESFRPEARLNGSLSIAKDNSGSGGNGMVNVASLSFENLILRTRSPYIQVSSISLGAGTQNDMGSFPVMINNIGFKSQDSRAGLSFNLIVNLMESSDEGFGASGSFVLWGKKDETSGRWKYDGIDLGEFRVDIVKADAFELHGKVMFANGDSTYGDGFKGELDAKFGGFGMQATALFGTVKKTRYWYADAMINIPNGIPVGSFAIYGFGGGAYYHMRQKGFNENKGSSFGATRSGIIYLPTTDVLLGLKASVAIGTARPEVMNGDATFEINFNSHGGINQIGFEGNVYFLTGEYSSAMSDVSKNTKNLSGGNSKPEKTSDGARAQIWGNIRLLFDNVNHAFHGEVKAYANVAGGVIKGSQPQDLAGTAVLHFDPSQWYIHIGSPDNPISLEIIRMFKTKSYFMAGYNLPGSPPPPAKVSEILGGMDLDYMRDLNALGAGRGLAFGSSFEFSTGDITFFIFYARLDAGAGFDIMLKDYGDAQCEGREGQIGINGWYANGQAYAYVEGSIGIKVDLLFVSGKFEILSVGMASVLQAKGPNPLWLKGAVGGRYSILGGLVSGNCHFEFTLGEECKIITASPLGGINIISELTPANGTRDVNVFNTPQAIFNIPLEKEMTIRDDEGKDRVFRIKLDYYKLMYSDKSVIPGAVSWNNEHDVAAYNNTDIFASNKDILASVQVSFEERINSAWQVVMFNGKKVVEKMENTFTSGTAPDYIPLSNLEYSYPVLNQFNFYKNEYPQGYVKLKKGQPELFTPPAGFVQRGRLTSLNGDQHLFSIAYTGTTISYSLPAGMNSNAVYTLDVVNLPAQAAGAIDRNVNTVITKLNSNDELSDAEIKSREAEGSIETLKEKTILTYYFRTSKYNSFNEKLNSLRVSSGWRRPLPNKVHELGITLEGDEMFDKTETVWNDILTPVVQFEALFAETPWYNGSVYPLVYQGYPLSPSAVINWRDVNILGIPPCRAVYIRQYPYDREVTADDLSGLTGQGTTDVGAFVYNADYFMSEDYNELRTDVTELYSYGKIRSTQAVKIVETDYPKMIQGNYPIAVKYVLPGINKITSQRKYIIDNPIPDYENE